MRSRGSPEPCRRPSRAAGGTRAGDAFAGGSGAGSSGAVGRARAIGRSEAGGPVRHPASRKCPNPSVFSGSGSETRPGWPGWRECSVDQAGPCAGRGAAVRCGAARLTGGAGQPVPALRPAPARAGAGSRRRSAPRGASGWSVTTAGGGWSGPPRAGAPAAAMAVRRVAARPLPGGPVPSGPPARTAGSPGPAPARCATGPWRGCGRGLRARPGW